MMYGETDAPSPTGTAELESEYEIIRELGRGGMAIVYHARDRELGRDVAIKVIRPRFASDEEAVARLAREARTVAQLQHPNIVTIYAVKRLRDGGIALVMQLIPGRTLKETIATEGPLPFDRAERVLREIGSALAHAHANGIVHRDVKPENIFIDETTGRALLSDFGVARSIEAESNLTVPGIAIGTPTYMSPEQIDGSAIDGRSDLYSLGLVGWEMISGQRPWASEGLYGVIYKQKREDLPLLDTIRPGTPDRLLFFIEGMLPKSPADRWPNAGALIQALESGARPAGWRKWQMSRTLKGGQRGLGEARARGGSFLNAAMETVRFRRPVGDEPSHDDPPATPPVDAPTTADEEARPVTTSGSRAFAPAPVHLEPREFADDIVDDDVRYPHAWTERRTSRRVPILMVALLALLVGGGAVWWVSRDTDSRALQAAAGSVLADVPGFEVPVRSPAPIDSVTVVTLDSVPTTAPSPTPERDEPIAATEDESDDARDQPVRQVATAPAVVPPVAPPVSPRAAPRETAAAPRTTADATREPIPQVRVQAPPVDTPRPRATDTAAQPTTRATSTPPISPATPPPTPAPTRAEPSTTISIPVERTVIAAGGRHSCTIAASGAAFCWGANDHGQLGDGGSADQAAPVPVAGDLRFQQIAASVDHSCGITRDGDAYCWGENDRGQLGDATTLPRSAPVRVAGGWSFRTIRTGLSHSCALAGGGELVCWGSNSEGQLGTGATSGHSSPVGVAGSLRFAAVSTGRNHTCAIATDGVPYCWGDNSSGQLGDGSRTDRRVPTRVSTSERFITIASGATHSCGISAGGDVYCWGGNRFGQIGSGDRTDHPTPTRVAGASGFAGVTAGSVHSCGRTRAGSVYCWGRNTYGQLGDGGTGDRTTPVRVIGGPFTSVQASGAHTCAATGSASYCWGYNVEGQLGDGTRSHRSRPTLVAVPPS